MWLKTVLILALASTASASIQWGKSGEKTTLTCQQKKCGGWLFNNTMQLATQKENECTLEIDAVEENVGNWACMGIGSVTINVEFRLATIPDEVQLTFSPEDYANLTKVNVTCSVDASADTSPMPTFAWYIADELLEDTDVYPGAFAQTLELDLNSDYINQTLRCEANFDDLATVNASQELNYYYDESYEDVIDIIPVIEVDGLDVTPIIVGIVVGIFIFAIAIYLCSRYGFCCFKNATEVDAEKGDKLESDTEKIDLTKEDRGEDESESDNAEQTDKLTLKARMASFFRVNKAFTSDEATEKICENGDVKENETKENGDVKIDMNNDEKKDLEKEAEATEKSADEPEEVVIEKKSGKSYRSFIAKMFKRDTVSDKETEEPVKMENDTEEDKQKDDLKEEQPEKNEVEEKPTEKEPTPNTSF